MRYYLAIPDIKIHNANAMSSSYTIGFPAMTAWLGAMHALQRRLRQAGFSDIVLKKIAVSCHKCDLQVYKDVHDRNFSIIGTANPLKKKGSSFERPPFMEEARCHLSVSILVEIDGYAQDKSKELINSVKRSLYRMKIAGGDIEPNIKEDNKREYKKKELKIINDVDYSNFRKKVNQLMMPGFMLVERSDLLTKVSGKDNLDSLIQALSVNVSVERNEKNVITSFKSKKILANSGWLVPAVVGFKDLTGKMIVANQRDYDYDHYFVEPLVTLGEFIMPYRCENIDSLMWFYDYDAVNGLYLCKNNYSED